MGELQALSVKEQFLHIFEDRVSFSSEGGHKIPFDPGNCAALFFSGPSFVREGKFAMLDVRRCLLACLKATADFQMSRALFILCLGINRGKRVQRASVARLIRPVMVYTYEADNFQCS